MCKAVAILSMKFKRRKRRIDMKNRPAAMTTLMAATAILASGCAGNRMARSSQQDAVSAPVAAAPAAPTGGIEAGEPVVRDDQMHPIAALKNVTFDYNSDRLGADARAVLNANAQWLKAHADLRVQVAGNCDQRGTVAYNLALGQRRAEAVRSYYEMLGVPGSRVATISYGKEKPVCREMTESCWQLNRRAETLGASAPLVGSN
jgi:peptidoglycan-associated lipoprotein